MQIRKPIAVVRLSPAAVIACAAAVLGAAAAASLTGAASQPANQLTFAGPTGQVTTLTTNGSFDMSNPFFQVLGTNGRTCATCHRPAQAWTITPVEVRRRFNSSRGEDPLFSTNDGANCDGADVSTLSARRESFSLLLSKGLIRVALTVPSYAEFKIVEVDDPYHCGAPSTVVSMFRRPLPATNLRFLSAVMWDGRETVPGQAIADDLATQARDATIGHAQGTAPSAEQLQQIVRFETALFTAQTRDDDVGSTAAAGALGGPVPLATQAFCIGVNDPLGMLPSMPGACDTASTSLNPTAFTIFDAWNTSHAAARSSVARGQRLFNTRTFRIDNVPGLNGPSPSDPLSGTPIDGGTCTLCHNAPNAGDHSVALPLNIGVADASRRTPDLPLYTLQNLKTGETVQTTDPGRAMITGKWTDIGKFKGPVLRALAARAPYFHNGFGATLADVVDFYDTRFSIGLTAQEKSDLVAFLKSL
jgi:cytochrome c peroxidase